MDINSNNKSSSSSSGLLLHHTTGSLWEFGARLHPRSVTDDECSSSLPIATEIYHDDTSSIAHISPITLLYLPLSSYSLFLPWLPYVWPGTHVMTHSLFFLFRKPSHIHAYPMRVPCVLCPCSHPRHHLPAASRAADPLRRGGSQDFHQPLTPPLLHLVP